MLTVMDGARLLDLRTTIAKLRPRTAAVFYGVCRDGLQNKAIAGRLKCSVRTIEQERATLCKAFGVETVAQLGVVYGEWLTLDRIERGGDREAVHHNEHEGHEDGEVS